MVFKSFLKSRSVAVVDAGSAVISADPGISDLAAGIVDFGEIVKTSEQGKFSEVSWGRQATIYSRSDKPAILVEALCDISEVVIVFSGSAGVASSLPLFAGLDGTIALVAGVVPKSDAVENALEDASTLGFRRSHLLFAARVRANVA